MRNFIKCKVHRDVNVRERDKITCRLSTNGLDVLILRILHVMPVWCMYANVNDCLSEDTVHVFEYIRLGTYICLYEMVLFSPFLSVTTIWSIANKHKIIFNWLHYCFFVCQWINWNGHNAIIQVYWRNKGILYHCRWQIPQFDMTHIGNKYKWNGNTTSNNKE